MDFSRLVFDDFYKFLMSFGVFLFSISLALEVFIVNNLLLNYILGISAFIFGIFIMILSGREWYNKQQNPLNEKLQAEIRKIIAETENLKFQTSQVSVDKPTKHNTRISSRYKTNDITNNALVSYKIASVLPGTVPFNFLKDWKVWFSIENQERKKYKAYIKIEFISDNYKERVADGYYGGTKAWNLNALSGVVAPGLSIPEKIKEEARGGKPVEIKIFCTVKDDYDNFIEEKLPVGYVYDPSNNSWYYEP
jgi:hypothetical protein